MGGGAGAPGKELLAHNSCCTATTCSNPARAWKWDYSPRGRFAVRSQLRLCCAFNDGRHQETSGEISNPELDPKKPKCNRLSRSIYEPRGGGKKSFETASIPGLFLQNEMRLDEELDPQPQSARRHVVHLLADAIAQVHPQVLPFAASQLQPKVVHFDDAQLPANLQKREREKR